MMIAGMLIQWVHGFDEIALLIAHGAGAIAPAMVQAREQLQAAMPVLLANH